MHLSPLLFSIILGIQIRLSRANTEIVNFVAALEDDVPISRSASWPSLGPPSNELTFSMQPALLHTPLQNVCEDEHQNASSPCPHDLWLLLELDHPKWAAYSSFTLRISWPASSPADFDIQLYSPRTLTALFPSAESARAHAHALTRRKYARIRAVDTGVRVPAQRRTHARDLLSFIVILEPLRFGFLPMSLSYTVICIVVVAVGAGLVVRPVNRYLEHVAAQAREEISNKKSD